MDRYDEAKFATWLGIIANAVLCVIKLVFGILGNSSALVADAFHTLSDAANSVVVVIALYIAAKPKDHDHPYGHGRAESMAAQVSATILIISALVLGWDSLISIIKGSAKGIPSPVTFWIACLSAVVKESMFQYKIRVGKRINSASVIADAWDHRADAFTAVIAMIGIGCSILFGSKWAFLDSVAACVIFAVVLYVGISIFKKTISELMDEAPEGEIVGRIRKVASGVKGVLETEAIRARKSGLDLIVEIHVEVDPAMSVEESHEVATQVKEEIMRRIDQVKFVMVHIEPFYKGDH
ncbi:MAG: cation diffusion facilitator family transporter [Candidatus Omnitrophica bacterium]|nr:cation diffusion facilitator family transporter [Candidatus Omnitrophota bacterium]